MIDYSDIQPSPFRSASLTKKYRVVYVSSQFVFPEIFGLSDRSCKCKNYNHDSLKLLTYFGYFRWKSELSVFEITNVCINFSISTQNCIILKFGTFWIGTLIVSVLRFRALVNLHYANKIKLTIFVLFGNSWIVKFKL